MLESSRNPAFLFFFLINLINFATKFIAAQTASYTCIGNSSVCYTYYCSNDGGNYTANSPYQQNLNTLLSSLPNTTSTNYGFSNSSAGQNPDRVNATALCRGDIDREDCRRCISNATAMITHFCPNQKEAMMWYDNCTVRYWDRSFSGPYLFQPRADARNENNAVMPAQFRAALRYLTDKLMDEAAGGGPLRKFATGNVTGPVFYVIYGLMQCTPDLTQSQCSDCLYGAMTGISSCCDGKIGGKVLWPSCNLRYEIYNFFTDPPAIALPSPPPPSPSSMLPLPPQTNTRQGKNSKRTHTAVAFGVPIIGCALLLGSICIFIIKRRKQTGKIDKFEPDDEEIRNLQYSFDTIKVATNYFSDANKLGRGGFGTVYKGVLQNGEEIAVKRLAKDSGQGELEFKNEVLLVARLQHRNLVRLRGFCYERSERLLIYEFMPNASLDHFLYDATKRENLDWETRFKIISGIARGILYLHEDSRLRIIHRDLKASNVLLDEEMNPKIADFGMAKLFVRNETQGDTSRIVGTYGYMAPEYAMHGHFSIKSDVFSFGVLILEIVSGRRNLSFKNGDFVDDLLSTAWRSLQDRTSLKMVDPIIKEDDRSIPSIVRSIHIALLCVQETIASRPTMATVGLMLSSSSLDLPQPSQPAFFSNSASIGEGHTYVGYTFSTTSELRQSQPLSTLSALSTNDVSGSTNQNHKVTQARHL